MLNESIPTASASTASSTVLRMTTSPLSSRPDSSTLIGTNESNPNSMSWTLITLQLQIPRRANLLQMQVLAGAVHTPERSYGLQSISNAQRSASSRSFQDHLGLGICVSPPVVTPIPSRLPLRFDVSLARGPTYTQVVAKQQVLALRWRIHQAYVDVYVSLPVRKRPKEPVQVVSAAQLDSKTLQLWDVALLVRQIRHADLDIDDRLSRQAGHGRRADMFDPQSNSLEGIRNEVPPRSEPRGPSPVVSRELDRVEAFAAFSHLESGPERGRDRSRKSLPLLDGQSVRLQTSRFAEQPVQVDHRRMPALDLVQTDPRSYRVGVTMYASAQEPLGQTRCGFDLGGHTPEDAR